MSAAVRELIKSIAATTIQDGGVTYSFAKNEFITAADAWFYPQYPAITRIVPVNDLTQALSDYVDRHAELLEQNNMFLGTWMNPESKNCHLDITTCRATKEEARKEARRINGEDSGQILAIYNPQRDTSVRLDV